MKHLFYLPIAAILLVGGLAMAETVSAPRDVSASDAPAAGSPPAGADDQGGTPDKWHWRHHGGEFMRRHDPLASLPKPLTADAVKQALEAEFAKRPQVKSVTETAPNVLTVEIIDRDGNLHKFELNETTGEHRKAW